MNIGDLVFLGDEVFAKVAVSMKLEQGWHWTFPVRPESQSASVRDPWRDDAASSARLECIFRRGNVQHWQLSLFGNATPENALRTQYLSHFTMTPSASPAGMVCAIDLVLHELGDDTGYLSARLNSMRSYFWHVMQRRLK